MKTDPKGICEEKCGRYNPKIDYTFARNFYQSLSPVTANEYDYRKVYYGEKNPFDVRSRKMILAKNCLSLIAQSSDDFLDLEQKLFSMLEGKETKFSAEQRKTLVEAEPSKETARFDKPFLYFLALANQECFGKSRLYFAIVSCLAKLVDEGIHPFVFYPEKIKEIVDEEKTNHLQALQAIEMLYYSSEIRCQSHTLMNLEDIKPKLVGLKSDLASTYGIQAFWIFGSFATGETTAYSDLDVYLTCNRELSFEEKGRVFGMIYSATTLPVDGQIEKVPIDEADDLGRAVEENNIQIF